MCIRDSTFAVQTMVCGTVIRNLSDTVDLVMRSLRPVIAYTSPKGILTPSTGVSIKDY